MQLLIFPSVDLKIVYLTCTRKSRVLVHVYTANCVLGTGPQRLMKPGACCHEARLHRPLPRLCSGLPCPLAARHTVIFSSRWDSRFLVMCCLSSHFRKAHQPDAPSPRQPLRPPEASGVGLTRPRDMFKCSQPWLYLFPNFCEELLFWSICSQSDFECSFTKGRWWPVPSLGEAQGPLPGKLESRPEPTICCQDLDPAPVPIPLEEKKGLSCRFAAAC